MFGFGTPELVIILVIMLVIFGPGKLPQLGSSLGGAIRSFKKAADGEPQLINPKTEEKKDSAETSEKTAAAETKQTEA